eukprot:CAMPEP_0168796622 /NCGR_PEP_ID=MMETSP0725-20121227/16858_1 /TAXON_ID=265536 /ORGANISM="Amphiprora sp., Strain CCMP467" /LENGTH=215 /DNA_ID=CAMNT_0008847759 /DNA_START=75 /DNA_END=723 /DNA_ORIENTATION=-
MTTSIIQCNSYPDFYGAAPEYDENGLVMMLQFPTGMSGTRRGRDDNDDDNDNAHVSSPLKKRKTKDFADCHDEVKQEQQKQQETTTTPRRPQWLSDKFYFGPVEFDMWSPPMLRYPGIYAWFRMVAVSPVPRWNPTILTRALYCKPFDGCREPVRHLYDQGDWLYTYNGRSTHRIPLTANVNVQSATNTKHQNYHDKLIMSVETNNDVDMVYKAM